MVADWIENNLNMVTGELKKSAEDYKNQAREEAKSPIRTKQKSEVTLKSSQGNLLPQQKTPIKLYADIDDDFDKID